jgi:hypothetical protein
MDRRATVQGAQAARPAQQATNLALAAGRAKKGRTADFEPRLSEYE